MSTAFSEPVLVLGLDPGTKHTGYGLVLGAGEKLSLVAQGRISPPAAWPLPRRLARIYEELSRLLAAHRPQAVAVEDIFHGPNARSALRLGHVRGVALLAAAQAGAEVFEYPPRLVKNLVSGYGQAEKEQVARMVAELLKFREPMAPDASDALAVAICHLYSRRAALMLPQASAAQGRVGRLRSWRELSEADLAALGQGCPRLGGARNF